MPGKWIVCAALFATAAAAYADAKWEVISQSPNATFYVDTASIARTGKTVNVWTKAVNSTPRIQAGDQVATAYGLDHFVFNCADKSVMCALQCCAPANRFSSDLYPRGF